MSSPNQLSATRSGRLGDLLGSMSTWPVGAWLAVIAFLAMVVNAYSFSLVAAIPLIQSDAWMFLDGFLGRFIEHGFAFSDLFVQRNPSDTNLPLQKGILFFHTRYFGMDFRVEGLFGVAAGIALTLAIARAASAKQFARWQASEIWLLAGLGLCLLSLNSTDVFTWPLATLWYLPILIGVLYMWFVYAHPGSRFGLVVAAFLLGITLDEVSFPILASVLGALIVLPHCRGPGDLRRFVAFSAIGLLASRLAYWWFNQDVVVAGAGTGRSFAPFLDPGMWKAIVVPLADSLVHKSHLVEIFGEHGESWGLLIGILLALAHLWFWWRAILGQRELETAGQRVTLLASSLMLLFYALIAGIVLQRVPDFGFDYLHQPRYVLFYELNLAALGLMLYRDYRYAALGRMKLPLKTIVLVGLVCLSGLQFRLSVLAWEHVKYLSAYLQEASYTMGRLAANPDADMECASIMKVCDFPTAKRRELMGRLVRYRLNLFSPEFQSFHRLHPEPRQPK